VKDLDKFEMIFQAHEYEQLAKKPGSLQEFFDTTKGRKLSMIVDFVISYNTCG
jgi:putative hydrolase of HD superfamily